MTIVFGRARLLITPASIVDLTRGAVKIESIATKASGCRVGIENLRTRRWAKNFLHLDVAARASSSWFTSKRMSDSFQTQTNSDTFKETCIFAARWFVATLGIHSSVHVGLNRLNASEELRNLLTIVRDQQHVRWYLGGANA